MSVHGWNTALVLGGIRSGKSEFAESLVADAAIVRFIATAIVAGDDDDWAARIGAHQGRRPSTWVTDEIGSDPARLARLIAEAKPDDTLLVDDLGGWVTGLLSGGDPDEGTGRSPEYAIGALAAAVRGCAARLVLVSPEVGLSLVPATPVGRAFADLLGLANRAVAEQCDAVALVVAGQPNWIKGTSGAREAAAAPAGTGTVVTPAALPDVVTPVTAPAEPAPTGPANALAGPTMTLPMIATGLVIQPGMELPLPDEDAAAQARARLATLDVPGTGLGVLERVVSFAAGTQGRQIPEPWRSVRVLLLHGDHDGDASAGHLPGESSRRADEARAGEGPLATLTAQVGATLQVVEAPNSGPMEYTSALTPEAVEAALRYGWRLAEQAVDGGVDLIVLASCGAGSEAAAAAVLATTTGAEVPAVLSRVVLPGGRVDDEAWMIRCAAARDAVHRISRGPRGPRDVLAEVAGADIAIATGVLLGATARRTPVLLDGPVGVSAALVGRDLAGPSRHWCLLPDHGQHPTVRLAADVLGLDPVLDLRLDIGEGAAALAALPLLRSALTLARTLPTHPVLAPRPKTPSAGTEAAEWAGPMGGAEPATQFTEPPPLEPETAAWPEPEPGAWPEPEPGAWPEPETAAWPAIEPALEPAIEPELEPEPQPPTAWPEPASVAGSAPEPPPTPVPSDTPSLKPDDPGPDPDRASGA
jgi:nicotinate-nucleotide--dimethylbenzimidazole phosphoribosyltransferase